MGNLPEKIGVLARQGARSTGIRLGLKMGGGGRSVSLKPEPEQSHDSR